MIKNHFLISRTFRQKRIVCIVAPPGSQGLGLRGASGLRVDGEARYREGQACPPQAVVHPCRWGHYIALFGAQHLFVQTTFWCKQNIWCQKSFSDKKIVLAKKIWCQKLFGGNNILVPKIF